MNSRVHNIVKISVNGYHLFSALSYVKFNNCKFHSALALQDECLVASVNCRLVFTISPFRTDLLRHRQHIQCTVQAMQVTLVFPTVPTRRPASADRTARRQFQATGQPVSRTQASDAVTSRLPRYEAKCVQRRCFQWGSVPLSSDIKGTELPPVNILIPLERQLIVLQLCH